MLLAILAAWFGYKKADSSGRNGILWAFICAGSFIGTQLAVGLLVGIGLGVGVGALGWDADVFTKYEVLVNVVAIAASILVVWLIFRYLDRLPEDESVVDVPPPPVFENDPERRP
jgi:hypothetical protein